MIPLGRLDTSSSNSPPQPGKVKILYLGGQKKSLMPVGLPGRGELGKRMSKPCIY